MQDGIERLLRETLGLDANSVGSRMIARAVEQRQAVHGMGDRSHYLALLRSSPQELTQLIEAVVIPETWFFRDKEPFEYLRYYGQERAVDEWNLSASKPLYILSLPCSTGEEPYSIAIALLEAGLTPKQFHIDAVDVSHDALQKAQQGIYREKSFRGVTPEALGDYFESTAMGYRIRSLVRNQVKFIQGNILEPYFLKHRKYHLIFCRNLLIYLDKTARDRTLASLDQALFPHGCLFLGSAETPQLAAKNNYQAIDYPSAFVYQKQRSISATPSNLDRVPGAIARRSRTQTPSNLATSPHKTNLNSLPKKTLNSKNSGCNFSPHLLSDQPFPASLETAKQLANQGQLSQAAQLCESYLRANPTAATAYLLLGEICQGLSQSRQAEQYFQRAIYLDPTTYEAFIHLALLKEQQGNQAASENLRKRAQRLHEQGYHSS